MIKVTVPDVAKVKAAIHKELDKLMTDKFATIGIHEDAGQHENDGITNASLGATLHFGTQDGHIPARNWLDVGVASGNEQYVQIITDGLEQGLPLEQILEQLGVTAVAQVQLYMTQLKSPPNAPSTVERKGSSNPLIDTGVLRSSVTHKITNTKPEEGIS